MAKRGHKTIEHPADMGIAGWGSTLEEAFEEVALAVFELAADGLVGRIGTGSIEIEVHATDLVDLLIEYLNRLITESDIHRLTFTGINVESIGKVREGWELKAAVHGLPMDENIDMLENEVKAATYYGAKVENGDDGWYAQCVVDL